MRNWAEERKGRAERKYMRGEPTPCCNNFPPIHLQWSRLTEIERKLWKREKPSTILHGLVSESEKGSNMHRFPNSVNQDNHNFLRNHESATVSKGSTKSPVLFRVRVCIFLFLSLFSSNLTGFGDSTLSVLVHRRKG